MTMVMTEMFMMIVVMFLVIMMMRVRWNRESTDPEFDANASVVCCGVGNQRDDVRQERWRGYRPVGSNHDVTK